MKRIGKINKMRSYINEVSKETREYYKILSKDFPEFLNDYIYIHMKCKN